MKNAINCFFIVCLLALFHAACVPNQEPGCGEKKMRDSVILVYPDTFWVHFQLDEKSVDVTQSFPLEHWEVDAVKIYIVNRDTINISWYYDQKGFDISKATLYMKNQMLGDSILGFKCSYDTYQINTGMISGVICKYSGSNHNGLRFLGKNYQSNYLILAKYKASPLSKKIDQKTICLLKSMDFIKMNE